MAVEHYVITTGDDITRRVTITKDGVPVAIDEAANVRASMVNINEKTVVGPVTCLSTAGGADWANGQVIVEFSAAQSATFDPGPSELQLKVDDNGIQTYHVPHISVVVGRVT